MVYEFFSKFSKECYLKTIKATCTTKTLWSGRIWLQAKSDRDHQQKKCFGNEILNRVQNRWWVGIPIRRCTVIPFVLQDPANIAACCWFLHEQDKKKEKKNILNKFYRYKKHTYHFIYNRGKIVSINIFFIRKTHSRLCRKRMIMCKQIHTKNNIEIWNNKWKKKKNGYLFLSDLGFLSFSFFLLKNADDLTIYFKWYI